MVQGISHASPLFECLSSLRRDNAGEMADFGALSDLQQRVGAVMDECAAQAKANPYAHPAAAPSTGAVAMAATAAAPVVAAAAGTANQQQQQQQRPAAENSKNANQQILEYSVEVLCI